MGDKGRFCASVSPWKAAISQGRGEVELWLRFLLLFQLSAVEAGGSTAFIYANFSVPVVKVRETCMSPPGAGKGRGDAALLCLISRRELWPSLSRCQTPTLGLPDLFWDACQTPTLGLPSVFWDAQIQSQGSQPCFGMPKPQLQGSQLHFGVPNHNSGAPGFVLEHQTPTPAFPALL